MHLAITTIRNVLSGVLGGKSSIVEREFSLMSTMLKSSDNRIFTVDLNTAQRCMTVKTMLDDLSYSEEDEDETIPLPNVNGTILEAVLEWCGYHKDDPPYVEPDENAEKRTDDICEWDKEFFQVENRMLFDIILAANYLDIKDFLDVGCKTVANMIKGKTPDEIRKAFGLKDNRENSEEDGPERVDPRDEIKKAKYEGSESMLVEQEI